MQNFVHIRFVKRNPVETHLPLNFFQNDRIFGFPDARLFLIYFFDFLIGSNRRGKAVRQPAEHFHRPYDIVGILYKRRHFSQ